MPGKYEMQFDVQECALSATASRASERSRNKRCFQDRLARKALRAEQKMAAEAYRLEDDKEAKAAKAEEIKMRRARARSEGAAKARRRARARSKRSEERRTQSQGDGGTGSSGARRGVLASEHLTSEEKVALASWELQEHQINSQQQELEARMRKRQNEWAKAQAKKAMAPTRVANPGLFRLDLNVPKDEDLVLPEEQTNTDWHRETAKERTKLMKEARPKRHESHPLSRILDNEMKKIELRSDVLGEDPGAPPRKPPKKKAPSALSVFGDDGGAAAAPKPMIRLPKLDCATEA